MEITQKEQDAWNAGLDAGREIERQNALVAAQAQPTANPNVGAAAQARRIYMHVQNGGFATATDIGRMVETIERLEAAQAQPLVSQSVADERAVATAFRDRLIKALSGLDECYLSRESIEQAAEDVLHSFTAARAALAAQASGQNGRPINGVQLSTPPERQRSNHDNQD